MRVMKNVVGAGTLFGPETGEFFFFQAEDGIRDISV